MARGIEHPQKPAGGTAPRSAGPDLPPMEVPRDFVRETRPLGARALELQLTPSEMATLHEIGRFRTVAAADLARFRYEGGASQMQHDLASLAGQGLLQKRQAWPNTGSPKLDVLVLTERGKKILERQSGPDNEQQVYAGFVKPSEVAHDAAIYRMYQAEKAGIEAAGGRVRRVVLDYEFKRRIYSPLGKAQGLPAREYAARQAEVAGQVGLKVVHGKIPLPDLRIEYETSAGEPSHVDLELATEHYRGSQMRDKAAAGFKMYAPRESFSRGGAAFDPEFAAQIFSL